MTSNPFADRRVLGLSDGGILVWLLGREVEVHVMEDKFQICCSDRRQNHEQSETYCPLGRFDILCARIADFVITPAMIHQARQRAIRRAHYKTDNPPWDWKGHQRMKFVKVIANMIKGWYKTLPKEGPWWRMAKLHYATFGTGIPRIFDREVVEWVDSYEKMMFYVLGGDLACATTMYERWRRLPVSKNGMPRGISIGVAQDILFGNPVSLKKSRLLWIWWSCAWGGASTGIKRMELMSIIERSTNAHALKAMRVLDGYYHRGNRKATTVGDFVSFVLDLPIDVFRRRNITLVGLAEECVRWHTLQKELQVPKETVDYAYLDMPAKIGSVAVRSIRNNIELYEEGKMMGHCVAGYDAYCRYEGTFILHLEMGKEQATAQIRVASIGKPELVQIYGPHNRVSPGVEKMRRVLTRHLRENHVMIVSREFAKLPVAFPF